MNTISTLLLLTTALAAAPPQGPVVVKGVEPSPEAPTGIQIDTLGMLVYDHTW